MQPDRLASSYQALGVGASLVDQPSVGALSRDHVVDALSASRAARCTVINVAIASGAEAKSPVIGARLGSAP